MKQQKLQVPEGFPNERLKILPDYALQKFRADPITRNLFPCRIGYFPKAENHYIERNDGCGEDILILCFAGEGDIRIVQTHVHLAPCDIGLIPAGSPHRYMAGRENPWSIGWIHFQGEMSAQYTKMIRTERDLFKISTQNMETIRQQFEMLYGLTKGTFSESTRFASHTTLAHLFSLIAQGKRESVPKLRQTNERINRVIFFMKENLRHPLRIEQMALVANWTPNHFSNVFKLHLKESPSAFFQQLKMHRAEQMLAEGTHSITEIADWLGFEDSFYFSRVFKKYFGLSPRNYQKSICLNSDG